MIIEIDITEPENADRKELINWKHGIMTMMDIRAKKGDLKALEAMRVCKRFIDEEIEKREKEVKNGK